LPDIQISASASGFSPCPSPRLPDQTFGAAALLVESESIVCWVNRLNLREGIRSAFGSDNSASGVPVLTLVPLVGTFSNVNEVLSGIPL
jgi:hypothetical protein